MENSDSQSIDDSEYIVNFTCEYNYVPPAAEYIDSLGAFGVVFVSLGTILTSVTLYLAVDACYTCLFTKESKAYKRNVLLIMSVYPIASLCSLLALSIPRSQLLSEAVTQIFLTIVLYRLYLLLIDVGRREVKKLPSLKLRVGPCCCWPCLPFPELEMNPTNLSWLQVIVLQLPIVQTLIYCIFLFMSVENPIFATKYGIFLQPLSVTSILLALYGLSITMMSLREANPGSNLRHKTAVVQMVLLFSKLQGFIVKSLPGTGLFPCNPPITPQVYANFTYNALMLIEMLFLCYAARLVYADPVDSNDATNGEVGFDGVTTTTTTTTMTTTTTENNTPVNVEDAAQNEAKIQATRMDRERYNNATNNNENCANSGGQHGQLNIRLAGVTA